MAYCGYRQRVLLLCMIISAIIWSLMSYDTVNDCHYFLVWGFIIRFDEFSLLNAAASVIHSSIKVV